MYIPPLPSCLVLSSQFSTVDGPRVEDNPSAAQESEQHFVVQTGVTLGRRGKAKGTETDTLA